MKLISIIVPVYNAAQYLDECISSVISQTYKKWELLLINDGSTDASGEICDKYVKLDSRIKVKHKANTGVSDSRNIALDLAKGDYIIFLDADDFWCLNNALKTLIEAATKYNCDIIRGDYKKVDENSNNIIFQSINNNRMKYADKRLSSAVFLEKIIHGEFFSVLSLFKKNAIINNRFRSDIS